MKYLFYPQLHKTPLVVAVVVVALLETSRAQNNPNDVADHAQRPRNQVAIAPETTRTLKALNERLGEIAKLWEAKDLEPARIMHARFRARGAGVQYGHLRAAIVGEGEIIVFGQ